jgi:LacI family transcriptional regulator, repressor for deo operon, udp, cdd, tsx, nupC, and nupG
VTPRHTRRGGEGRGTRPTGSDTRRSSRPTIADVARRVGVSRAAVSFAVNGRAGVGEETRTRILRAAEELGWRPNGPARALSQARAGAVGLVLARQADHLEVDDFFVRFLAGVERTLAAHDYALVLQVVAPEARGSLDAYRRLITSGRVDGMVLTDTVLDDPRIELLVQSGLPAVIAGRPWASCPFPVVETQHARGMASLVEHLVAAGHRSVAFIGGDPAYEHVAARRWEWMNTMRQAGLEPGLSASVVPEDTAARAATARMLQAPRRPTAIVYTSDLLALAGLSVARELRLAVPGDVSIAGFDDSPPAWLSSPPLTTVRVDNPGFGEAAAAVLLAEIDGTPPPRFEPAPPELIVRGSTGPAPRTIARPATITGPSRPLGS